MPLYEEAPEVGNEHREAFLNQFEAWLDANFEAASAEREQFFRPDFSSVEAYERSIVFLRERFRQMLGRPLTELNRTAPDVGAQHAASRADRGAASLPADQRTSGAGDAIPAARTVSVAQDDLGHIERIWIEVFSGLDLYGLLFVPHGPGAHPLVISQHGGLGTPELTAGFFGSANYSDMTRRVLRRGAVVYAPQLFRWDVKFGPQPDVVELDRQMKQLGGSIAAFELTCLARGLDHLLTRPEVDPERVGMVGLSYGGFFALYAAAADPRIGVTLSSCFFNDRRRYGSRDWGFFNAANTFFDAEVAGLVCPRHLYLEVAQNDELLDVASARPEAEKVAGLYERLGISERFVYHEHPGKHEFDPSDEGIDFLCRNLGLANR